ncbi:MAG: putative oxidoreductase C-terminal domain-containing protein [Siphonobacter sp.]
MRKTLVAIGTLLISALACQPKKEADSAAIKLLVLDPGHFHAALVQKSMYEGVSPDVHVYAPEGAEVKAYLDKIEKYNTRPEAPTHWKEEVYKGSDYLAKMLQDKSGNLVILAGNNQKKTDYIQKSVEAGLNVLSDKPMAINAEGFETLRRAFATADQKKVLLYDIMTERYEITNTLQRELAQLPELFGELQKGTPEQPGVVKESVHHFFKYVSGEALVRPAWFFDVKQQGEGLVDVTTHLVDLIQWACFPDQTLDYQKDVRVLNAKHWTTPITPSQFKLVTKSDTYPAFLTKDLKDSVLNVYSNGELNYTLKGVHAKVSVIWNFQPPANAGDTHYSIMRGSKANLIIRQGAEQKYKPMLYIEIAQKSTPEYEKAVEAQVKTLEGRYPGISLKKTKVGWEVVIPEKYANGHEAHFAQVAQKYLQFLKDGKLPEWEVPNMITKYYTTTQALKMATNGK